MNDDPYAMDFDAYWLKVRLGFGFTSPRSHFLVTPGIPSPPPVDPRPRMEPRWTTEVSDA